MAFTLAIFTMDAFLFEQNVIKTVSFPLQKDYEDLYDTYSTEFECSCGEVSIEYSNFIEIKPHYHELCSSEFVASQWYTSLDYSWQNPGASDFTKLSSAYFRSLHVFCEISNLTMQLALDRFLSTSLISTNIVPRSQFDSRFNSSIEGFFQETLTDFLHRYSLISNLLNANDYVSGSGTNTHFIIANIISSEASLSNPVWTQSHTNEFLINNDEILFCARDWLNMTLSYDSYEGIQACSITQIALDLSISCWYDLNCIEIFKQRFAQIGVSIGEITPLNSTKSSRFDSNRALRYIFNEMMIESFESTFSYDLYYQTCKPRSCTYNYRVRSDTIYVVTTAIGLVGGISIIIRACSLVIVNLLVSAHTNSRETTSRTTSISSRRQTRQCK